MFRMIRFLPFLFIILSLVALPACTSHLQQKENFLREAGFHPVTPVTPAQIAHVKALPQGHITEVTRHGKTLFMLADARKNLLLVGGNSQYERYQQILYTKVVDPAIASEKTNKMLESEWNAGWGGMFNPFFAPGFY